MVASEFRRRIKKMLQVKQKGFAHIESVWVFKVGLSVLM